MSYQPADIVEVYAWGRRVGVLASASGRRGYAFQYDPVWIRDNIELSPLLMPLRRAPYAFPSLPAETFHGLPPMLADSLPDAFGNGLVNAWMATQGIARNQITSLDRLVYLGIRGMGALEYQPDQQPYTAQPTALDMGELVVAARQAVQGNLATEGGSEHALKQIINVGMSAGGARAKAIINLNTENYEIRSGHLPPEPGFEPWLLKFDGVGQDLQLGGGEEYGRVEYAYSLMAVAAGIHMSRTELLTEHGRAHFMTKRFDRDAGRKIHMQTLTGLAGIDFNAIGANSYAQLFTAIESLGLPAKTKTEAWRRMAFNVAAANNDDHAKNFSFLATEDGQWQLSPAYDITHAYRPDGQWTSQHLMSVNGKFRDISYRDLQIVADQFLVPSVVDAARRIRSAIERWPDFAAEAGLTSAHAEAIARDFHLEALTR